MYTILGKRCSIWQGVFNMGGQVYSFHPETADAFTHTWAQEQFYFNQTHTKRWWKGSSCADPLLVDKRTLSPVKLRITWILDTQGYSYTNPNIFLAYSRLFSIGMSLMGLSRTCMNRCPIFYAHTSALFVFRKYSRKRKWKLCAFQTRGRFDQGCVSTENCFIVQPNNGWETNMEDMGG